MSICKDFLVNQNPRKPSRQKLSTTKAEQGRISSLPCPHCAGRYPLWGYRVFREKDSIQRPKFSAEKTVCFSCPQADRVFPNSPKARNCWKPECKSTHNALLHGADCTFPHRKEEKSLLLEKLWRIYQFRSVSHPRRTVKFFSR